jgi:hypothetical protein
MDEVLGALRAVGCWDAAWGDAAHLVAALRAGDGDTLLSVLHALHRAEVAAAAWCVARAQRSGGTGGAARL